MILYQTLTFYPFESFILKQPKRKAYWKWKDKDKLTKKQKAALDPKPLLDKGIPYCSIDGQKVEKKRNTVKIQLNGQLVFNATYSWHQRAFVVNHYHKYFEEAVRRQLRQGFHLLKDQRFFIEYILDYPENEISPDIDNMWLIPKIFHDTIRDMKLIDDDSRFYIDDFRMRYIDSKSNQRNLTINIYKK